MHVVHELNKAAERLSVVVASLPGFLLGGRSVVVGPGVVEGGAEAGTEKRDRTKR